MSALTAVTDRTDRCMAGRATASASRPRDAAVCVGMGSQIDKIERIIVSIGGKSREAAAPDEGSVALWVANA